MHLPTNWLVLAACHNYTHRASRLELPNTYSSQKKSIHQAPEYVVIGVNIVQI